MCIIETSLFQEWNWFRGRNPCRGARRRSPPKQGGRQKGLACIVNVDNRLFRCGKVPMFRKLIWSVTLLGFSCLEYGRAEAGFVLTANAAGSQSSTLTGVTTETFNSFGTGRYTTLSTAVGTLNSPAL